MQEASSILHYHCQIAVPSFCLKTISFMFITASARLIRRVEGVASLEETGDSDARERERESKKSSFKGPTTRPFLGDGRSERLTYFSLGIPRG